MAYRKTHKIIFPETFIAEVPSWVVRACKKIKIGHRENFRAKNKCFRQILFPVRAILRSINFRYADFNTDSADACILVIAFVDCVQLKTLSSLLKSKKEEKEFAANILYLYKTD